MAHVFFLFWILVFGFCVVILFRGVFWVRRRKQTTQNRNLKRCNLINILAKWNNYFTNLDFPEIFRVAFPFQGSLPFGGVIDRSCEVRPLDLNQGI